MQMRSAAASVLGSTVARALKVRSPIRTDRRQNRKGKRCMMMRGGGLLPRYCIRTPERQWDGHACGYGVSRWTIDHACRWRCVWRLGCPPAPFQPWEREWFPCALQGSVPWRERSQSMSVRRRWSSVNGCWRERLNAGSSEWCGELRESYRHHGGSVYGELCHLAHCPLWRFYGSGSLVGCGDNQMRWGVSP